MRLVFAALLTLAPALTISGCNRPSGEAHVSITNPNINLPAVRGRPASGYFELEATAERGALTSVTSPKAGRVEMHETVETNGMSSMRPVARIAIDEGKPISFSPGGRHLMLFDIDPALAAGQQAELTFHFEKGEPVTTIATVQSPGGGHGSH